MSTPPTKKPAPHHPHPPENTMAWYFYEFWPVMLFAFCFILMCSTPVALSAISGAHQRYSTSGVVDFRVGLGLFAAFVASLAVLFTLPRMIGWYVWLLGVFALVFFNGFHPYNALHWGPWIAIWYLTALFLGNFFLPRKEQE